jgi:RNA polymerase sigma factor (sigma-70 family)
LHREQGNINEIIDGCRNDDRMSQEKLYRNYYRAMMTLCLRYTKNEQDALEVLNTGFLKIFRSIRQFDPNKASLYTWMRTIIINSCIDFIKSRQVKFESVEEVHAAETAVSPEIISKLRSDELLQLIRQLPPATQAVFNLYVQEGYQHKEIAGMLGISEGTSKWHLSDARKTLKRLLKEE